MHRLLKISEHRNAGKIRNCCWLGFFNFFFKKNFEGTLIVSFGFLVMSALGFKPRVDPFCACVLACMILRFTSGATPTDCVEVSMACDPFNLCTCKCIHNRWWRFGVWTHNPLCGKHSAVYHSATPARLGRGGYKYQRFSCDVYEKFSDTL